MSIPKFNPCLAFAFESQNAAELPPAPAPMMAILGVGGGTSSKYPVIVVGASVEANSLEIPKGSSKARAPGNTNNINHLMMEEVNVQNTVFKV